ncbi:MAG TPA: hypothetical protein VLY23_08130 [Candidatus Acidoferrum sp.]|nr:hypothetical protein [Candidatus Acidoferrum sp.]
MVSERTELGLVLRKLLQKSRGVTVVPDRSHDVLNLSLDLLFTLPHLLDFAAEIPEGCA